MWDTYLWRRYADADAYSVSAWARQLDAVTTTIAVSQQKLSSWMSGAHTPEDETVLRAVVAATGDKWEHAKPLIDAEYTDADLRFIDEQRARQRERSGGRRPAGTPGRDTPPARPVELVVRERHVGDATVRAVGGELSDEDVDLALQVAARVGERSGRAAGYQAARDLLAQIRQNSHSG